MPSSLRLKCTRINLPFTVLSLVVEPLLIIHALISQIYFWHKTLHVSDSSSAHHQQFFTVHTAMVYVI